MKYAENAIDLIGNTPLVRLGRYIPNGRAFAKCEFLNPLSLKDRPVKQIIQDAEERGELKPGDTLLEATSGNTGLAIVSIAAIKGYKVVLVMSEIQSIERRKALEAFGAELVLTPASEGTAGAREKLKEIQRANPDYYYVGQHVNPSNPEAHYHGTGPELWQDTGGEIDVLIAGLGTGGTICGAGRYLKERKPEVRLIAIEPEESPYVSKGIFNPHRMMGTAPGFIPDTLDRDIIDEIFLVSEAQAFQACRDIARSEGMLVGITSGAVAYAAKQVAQGLTPESKLVVGIFADSGQRYLSVEGLYD